MKRIVFHKTIALLISAAFILPCFSQKHDTLKIVIIRHGEKSNTIDSLSCDSSGVVGDNLSCRGLNRALALADTLYQKFGVPDHVYVPSLSLGKSTGSSRMFQTVTPFAVRYNLKINSEFKETDTKAAADSMLKKKKGTVLVVWEHGNIPALVNGLGVKNAPKWKCTDFDSIWIVTVTSKDVKLSTKEKEGINPSPDCP